MNSSQEDPPGYGVRLQALVAAIDQAADEERRALSSTRRVVSRLSIARLMLAARRAREPFIDPAILGEPAWDLLLFLYITYREGRSVGIEAATAASQVSPSVARRWIDLLVHKGLIKPIVTIVDEPQQFLYLTDNAIGAMESAIDHYLNTGADYL